MVFSLLQKHYYYHLKNNSKENEVKIGMEELMDHVGSVSDDENSYSDSSSTLTTISQDVHPTLKVNHPKICAIWNNLCPEEQIRWSKRALALIKMPKLGYFTTIPCNLVNQFYQIDINLVLECMSQDWLRFMKK